LSRGAWRAHPRRDHLRDVLGVPADAVNHRRGQCVEEEESDEVEAGLSGGDAALLDGLAMPVEDGEIDPGESGMEAGAPHDVRDVEDAPVDEKRLAVLHARDPRDTPHPGGREVASPGADERTALRMDDRRDLAADGRAQREDAVEHEPEEKA